ncbi:dUTPase [Anaerobacillus alkalilacustris]|uniref:dUTPase n=1 Tax=Anaerobacillus alkalilacustris TaxID=393763 RepID=A0A1S2LLQ3_9BACI|nr:dUTP diphosphatase [Anaerobacillus alkalilacustris]OIJ12365.1 dUTPase [Anaerobacillus alkalilacustris]
MDLIKMFQLQKELDNRIREEHNVLGKNLIAEKVLAFQVELGELANETRCFKYWSLKQPSSQEVILEEYVDGFHFLLSIGIDISISIKKLNVDTPKINSTLTNQFATLYSLSSQFEKTKDESDFIVLFQRYLVLGKLLGFTDSDIETAYRGKNEVNHQRQNDGY